MNDPAIRRQDNNPPLSNSENAIIVREAREKRFRKDPDIFKRMVQTRKKHQLEELTLLLGGDPKQVLEDLYFEQGLLQKDIAHRFHKSKATINDWFKMFGITTIPTRAVKTVQKRQREQVAQLLGGDPKAILEDLYFKQKLSQNDIAHRFQKHPETIRNWFKIFGITAHRSKRAGNTRREHYIEEVKQLLGEDPKQVLEDLYFKQGLSTTDIAHRFHNSQPTISKWFKIFGISTSRSRRAGNTRREHYIEEVKTLLGGDPKAILEDLYFKQGLSQKEIAIRFHKRRESVTHWFEMFGISTNRIKRAGKTVSTRQLEQLKQLLGGDPKEVLEDLYFKQGLTQTDIAHRVHKNPMTVSIWFKWFGITAIRNRAAKTNREHMLERLKKLLGGEPKAILEDLYFKQKLSQEDIAHRFHKTDPTVSNWFKILGITTIPQGRSKKLGGSVNSEMRDLVLSAMKNGSFEKLSERRKKLLSLRYLQTGKPLTLDEIAEKMGGISRQRVHELEKATLKRLQNNERTREYKGVHLRQKLGGDPKEMLEELHIRQGLSHKDIAYRFGVTHMAVRDWFKKFGIPLLQYPNVMKSDATTEWIRTPKRLKQQFGGDPKEVLESLYTKQRLSVKEIAIRFHKTDETIRNWFKKYGIPLKEANALHDNAV